MIELPPWAWPVLAYLVAAVPVGVLLARARGIDLRQVGSGNIGATNAMRAMGPRWGLLVAALDILKAYAPVVAASRALQVDPAAQIWIAATGAAAVTGHIFPVYLRFRGGKGVACALGVVAALDPWLALAGTVLYAQALFLTRTSAVGSLTAVTAMTLTALLAERSVPFQILMLGIALLVWARHASNVKQLVSEAKARKLAQTGQK